jgi:hypothetical protein
MTGAEFEHYVGEVFYDNGHHSAVTKGSGDYGVDLVLDGKIAVQVKMYTSPVGPGAVQQVIAGRVMYGCAEAWVVTNSTFTRAARALAKANDVRLIAGDELQWIADNPDKTADHRARYEAALAEAEEKKRAERAARKAERAERAAQQQAELEAWIAYAKGQGPKPPARRGDGPDRRTIAPPGPPSVRQRIAGWKSRREAEAIADEQAARAKQIADWHTRTGAWWRRQEPDSTQPAAD